ncbi:hypothetical protein L873DRAFT_115605 [Choiromyces venosus 120613-1]|uniref:Uncharacterized protein n=1 Tax=Choiromyces venosus 120613-1 TaxID=1336337 RepID=A0A3N4J6P7_9PEZI|nr:hypothetical protein L873DRAFT_115605 [Choiromyces venosus 120613-1]
MGNPPSPPPSLRLPSPVHYPIPFKLTSHPSPPEFNNTFAMLSYTSIKLIPSPA